MAGRHDGVGFFYCSLCLAATVSETGKVKQRGRGDGHRPHNADPREVKSLTLRSPTVCSSSWYMVYPLKKLKATETPRNITSPNYPDFYPVSIGFQCVITASSPDEIVWLKVVDVELKEYTDYIDIYDGAEDMSGGHLARIRYFNTKGMVLVSTQNQMYVRFHSGQSDTDQTGRGFWLIYKTLQKGSESAPMPPSNSVVYRCSNTVQTVYADASEVKYIVSSDYPNIYPSNTVCQWRLMAPPHDRLLVRLVDVDLQAAGRACADSVTLYEQDSRVLGEFCTTKDNGKHFNSSGRLLSLRFVSEGKFSGRGFVISYEQLSHALPVVIPTSTPALEIPRDNTVNTVLLIGLGLGTAVCVLATCVGIIYICTKRRSSPSPPAEDNQQTTQAAQPLVIPSAPSLPPDADESVYTVIPTDAVEATNDSANVLPNEVASQRSSEDCSEAQPAASAPPPSYEDLGLNERGGAPAAGIAPPPVEDAPPAYCTVSGYPNTFV